MCEATRVISVVGTRPNFVKVAPIIKALDRHPRRFVHRLVHTGQHYDDRLSESFFVDLDIPKPDVNLGVGSGSHAEQTAKVMLALEPVLGAFAPDVVVVIGDVNSTLAATLTARKLGLRVAHVEAGLRSGDNAMPEEINRRCTDAIADELFTTDRIAGANLRRENIAEDRIHFVGNVMIDSLTVHRERARRLAQGSRLGLEPRGYAVLTLHRPANVDRPEKLAEIVDAIRDALPDICVVFPAHPRTRRRIDEAGLGDRFTDRPGRPGIVLVEPLGYLRFLSLVDDCRMVLTDSGGLQEETTVLGVPCVTLRDNTERPITVEQGTNRIAGTTRAGIIGAIVEARCMEPSRLPPPEKWDGRASERIAGIIAGWTM